jgi:hypothetical protein
VPFPITPPCRRPGSLPYFLQTWSPSEMEP